MEGQSTYKKVFQFSKVDSMIHVIVFCFLFFVFFFHLVEHGILEGTVEENTVCWWYWLNVYPQNSYILKYYAQRDGI